MDRYQRVLRGAVGALTGGDFEEAARQAALAIELRPDLGIGWRVQGEALLAHGELEGAARALRESVRLEPFTPAAHAALGAALQALGRVKEPMECFAEALRLAPGDPRILSRAGHFLLEQGQLDEAEGCFRAALNRATHGGAAAGLAGVLERRGDLAGAEAALAIWRGTGARTADLALASARVLRRRGRPAEALPLVEAALEQPLSQAARVLLLHALGDLKDALGDADAAFAAWTAANRARGLRFDAAAFSQRVDATIRRWPRRERRLGDARPGVPRGVHPVLIVGMPRSGTTLVEQILAGHPAVTPGGELDDLPPLARELEAMVPATAAARAGPLAVRYADRLRSIGAGLVTDKLPQNFLHLGAAALIAPGARVIHCRRDPVDTCFSCFRQNFHATHDYATELTALGAYWRGYDRLMAHWRAAQPLPMFEVSYEALVADPEPVARALLAFLGLEWHPACLETRARQRVVNTASYDQVRRPIYRSSVGRAAPYAAHLAPLRAALGLERGAVRERGRPGVSAA